jgi:hypothetical protein
MGMAPMVEVLSSNPSTIKKKKKSQQNKTQRKPGKGRKGRYRKVKNIFMQEGISKQSVVLRHNWASKWENWEEKERCENLKCSLQF